MKYKSGLTSKHRFSDRLNDGTDIDGIRISTQPSPFDNRRVLEASAELSSLVESHGGNIDRIYDQEQHKSVDDWEDIDKHHWDASGVAAPIAWLVSFGAGATGVASALKFLSSHKVIGAANLNQVTIKGGGLSMNVRGDVSIEDARIEFEKLAVKLKELENSPSDMSKNSPSETSTSKPRARNKKGKAS
jgi:hypothetical protein